MKILFYAPFKPLGHGHPSGDLVTATEIVSYLVSRGHEVIRGQPLALPLGLLEAVVVAEGAG